MNDRLTSADGRWMVAIQRDGNLVVYAHDGTAVWGSGVPAYDPGPLPGPAPHGGVVKLDRKVMVDAGGPWLPLGASLFWAVRGARAEPDRLVQNLQWLRTHSVDFVRVFAETTDWTPETRTDPRWPDYVACLRRTRDLAAAEGLRIAWTIFGGNALSRDEQATCLSRVLEVCAERPETVQYVEISNEGNGLRDGFDVRAAAATWRGAGFVTALTAVDHAALGLYQGSAANVATVHFERRLGDNGWRPVRQPWGYPGEYGQGLPVAFISGEPIGPGSSVASETDPEKIAQNAVHTWLCGGCAHVVHFGAGIYGVQTSHPVGGVRPPNVWEQPSLEAALRRITVYRGLLPPDLPNWTRTRHGLADHPFRFPPNELETVGDGALARGRGCVRAYAAYRDGQYVMAVIGIMQAVTLAPQHTDGTPFSLPETEGTARLVSGVYR